LSKKISAISTKSVNPNENKKDGKKSMFIQKYVALDNDGSTNTRAVAIMYRM
jgi:hypothetical protein